MFAVLLLALWGLAAVHCKLEALPGFQFLDTCCATDSAPSSPKDCSDDGCDSVENGGYRAGDQTLTVPEPLRLPLTILPALEPESLQPNVLSCRFLAPPEIPRGWQFSCRAASSPRAPSVVS